MNTHLCRLASAIVLLVLIGDVTVGQNIVPVDSFGEVLDSTEVAKLLVKPACLSAYVDSARTCVVKDVPVQSKGIVLSGQLYLPALEGRWPLVILVPGGFNEEDLIMQAPRYYAPRLAHCGFAVYVYWKRGTGSSGGIYAEATYDDFIDDIANIADALSSLPQVEERKIGVFGGSSGGLLASVAAARSKRISFVINTSGPIVPTEEANNFNIRSALRARGYADSLIQQVMPLWRRHHAAWANSDTSEHEAVAADVSELRKHLDPFMLPTPYQEVFADSGLVFMWPAFRSAHRDFLAELRHLHAKWLNIFGERDEIVPVTSCVQNILALGKAGGNAQYEIIVLPNVDHSFINRQARSQVPVIRIIVNWLNEAVLGVRL